MDYYGFTKEQIDRMVTLLNSVSVTGMNQIDAFHEATEILRKPVKMHVDQKKEIKEGAKEDGSTNSQSNN